MVILATVERHVGTLLSQAQGNATADALGTAGDQGDSVRQSHPPTSLSAPFRLP
jgi:hypothetical protein